MSISHDFTAKTRHQRVQELHGRGKPRGQDVQQHPTAQGQAPRHVLGAREGRVRDEAAPAHRGAGLLQVGPVSSSFWWKMVILRVFNGYNG